MQHQTVIFDHVETNIGQAYNQHSGVFTVPISGVYIFSYTVFTDANFTGCTVLALKLGDVCFVRLHPTYPKTGLSSGSAMRSSFSGVKM